MTHRIVETASAVTLEPSAAATASVIWLHGLGADGHDFVPLVPELQLPPTSNVRLVFPHAPVRAVTLNNGYQMRAWYDIQSLSPGGRGDSTGMAASVVRVATLVDAERARGVAADRIVIAGFSQGGAVTLHTALTYPERLGGAMALSTYLPLPEDLATRLAPANRALSVLMCHGRHDPVVIPALGAAARDWLQAAGYAVEWHEYPMRHELCAPEVAVIRQWLNTRLA